MSFSIEWDRTYQEGGHLSTWPWSDLVSYVYRYARPSHPDFRVLELGCGAGANIPFFQKLGVQYFAVEGSPFIVTRLKQSFPELSDHLIVGDFTAALPFAETFDLIVDRASITHNSTAAIQRCLELVHQKLNPGGRFIGLDWFSTAHSDYHKGEQADDPYTRTGLDQGTFSGVGKVHFSDKEHLLDLFGEFELSILEHKTTHQEHPQSDWTFAAWNLVAQKPL